ncbi:Phage Minor tail protein [Xanthomonas phage Suba]|uniref:Phage Minor tail protein n=1 Tax=Xanthomonas phage Suba TaxID=2674975 RepID=A0A679KAJ3_9CAUD|nr:Phage Minor tail protein [Xanthomonas phage Suba]CAA2409750.1 Phage Minor tail protein [Xanthomonas phage Suba]
MQSAAAVAANLGNPVELAFSGIEGNAKLPRDKVCARLDVQHILDDQQTLSNCVEEPFKKRYLVSGMLFVEFYAPKTTVNAAKIIGELAEIAKAAFRGREMNGNITFRRTRIVTAPKEDDFYRLDVSSDFEYNQIG